MSETQNQDAPQTEPAENAVPTPAPENAGAPEVSAPAEEKHERLVESKLEASLSDVLPLSPIETAAPEAGRGEDAGRRKHGRRGLRRGNSGRGSREGKNPSQSVGVVENPGEATETLSGKFVDGYDKDKEFRKARERREKAAEIAARADAAPAAQGWCLTESSKTPPRRHPQSNTNANRAKLIIEPAPIPEQEKDPSFWQKFKAKILSIFGLDKKKKKDKNRRGGRNRNRHGKKFRDGNRNGGGEFRKDGNRNGEFRGGNRRNRHNRGPRPGNSGARPQNNGGNAGGDKA